MQSSLYPSEHFTLSGHSSQPSTPAKGALREPSRAMLALVAATMLARLNPQSISAHGAVDGRHLPFPLSLHPSSSTTDRQTFLVDQSSSESQCAPFESSSPRLLCFEPSSSLSPGMSPCQHPRASSPMLAGLHVPLKLLDSTAYLRS